MPRHVAGGTNEQFNMNALTPKSVCWPSSAFSHSLQVQRSVTLYQQLEPWGYLVSYEYSHPSIELLQTLFLGAVGHHNDGLVGDVGKRELVLTLIAICTGITGDKDKHLCIVWCVCVVWWGVCTLHCHEWRPYGWFMDNSQSLTQLIATPKVKSVSTLGMTQLFPRLFGNIAFIGPRACLKFAHTLTNHLLICITSLRGEWPIDYVLSLTLVSTSSLAAMAASSLDWLQTLYRGIETFSSPPVCVCVCVAVDIVDTQYCIELQNNSTNWHQEISLHPVSIKVDRHWATN